MGASQRLHRNESLLPVYKEIINETRKEKKQTKTKRRMGGGKIRKIAINTIGETYFEIIGY